MQTMDGEAPRPLKPRLLALVAQGQAEHEDFVEQLSPAERAAIGEPDAWAAKDHVAHNTAWKADAAYKFNATRRGEAYFPESTSVFNPRVFAEQQHKSWDAILADTERADTLLRACLEACSEAELTDPERFPWRDGIPLWCTALVSGYEHPAEHYAQYYLQKGDLERATTIREEAVKTARHFIGDTEHFGYMVYNLGCFYAQSGRSDLAIATIRESFPNAPSLREAVREDPELVSLRNNPAFHAFVAELVEPADTASLQATE